MPLRLTRFGISAAMKHIFFGCGPVCGPLQGRIQTGEDVKKKLRFLREERLSPHEVKPDGFVDHFFTKKCLLRICLHFIQAYPLFFAKAKKMVGVRGFEPPASASRTQRSSQTEPHPDLNDRKSSFSEVVIII